MITTSYCPVRGQRSTNGHGQACVNDSELKDCIEDVTINFSSPEPNNDKPMPYFIL